MSAAEQGGRAVPAPAGDDGLAAFVRALMAEAISDVNVHTTEAMLYAMRRRVERTRGAAAELRAIGHADLAAELAAEAEALARVTVWVPVKCVMHQGPFEAEFSAGGPASATLGRGICGPCVAEAEAEVARWREQAEAEERQRIEQHRAEQGRRSVTGRRPEQAEGGATDVR
jgi:hypothetical protein